MGTIGTSTWDSHKISPLHIETIIYKVTVTVLKKLVNKII